VPELIQAALAAAADAPGYPLTMGTPQLRRALVEYVARRCGAELPETGVLPTIGSKELVASLPFQLGLGPGDTVAIPSVCYPTYEVGARLAGAAVAVADTPEELDQLSGVRMVWVNSPGNPDGRVLTADQLRDLIDWTRAHGAVLVSDECYLELGWDEQPVSALSLGRPEGIIAVHSLSKRCNLAGYRAGFVAGDSSLVGELLAVRKHAGYLVPTPVQAAMVAALGDDAHVAVQRQRYARRRELLRSALLAAGFRIDASKAGLYLWATRDEDCWSTVDWLAARGVLAAPGTFYGVAGARHVRLALTATDERIAAACARLTP
jgi:succinyldiaminopimelate transaminase